MLATIDARPCTSAARCVSVARHFPDPAARTISFNTHTERRGRSNSEHLAVLVDARTRSRSTSDGGSCLRSFRCRPWSRGPSRWPCLGIVTFDVPLAPHQRGRGLQHRIHPVVCVIGQVAVASSQFPVPSSQFPVPSFQLPVSTSRTVSGFECPKIGLPPCRRHDWALQLATETDS